MRAEKLDLDEARSVVFPLLVSEMNCEHIQIVCSDVEVCSFRMVVFYQFQLFDKLCDVHKAKIA